MIKEVCFAAVKVRTARNVDENSIWGIGCCDRTVMDDTPASEGSERRHIRFRGSLLDTKVRNKDLRVCNRHTGLQTKISGVSVQRANEATLTITHCDDERSILWRRMGVLLPLQPIRRPIRQMHRDDPLHPRPPQ